MVECGFMDLAEVDESGQTVVHIAAGHRHCHEVSSPAALRTNPIRATWYRLQGTSVLIKKVDEILYTKHPMPPAYSRSDVLSDKLDMRR